MAEQRTIEQRLECYVCHREKTPRGVRPMVELRPYGPNGELICFQCMIGDPVREASAKEQFGSQLEACGPIAVIDGHHSGPRPFGEKKS